MEHRVLPGQGIKSVVVAKRTLQLGFGGVAVAFDDDVGLGRHPQVLGQSFRDGKGFLPENASKLVLREVVGQGRDSRKDQFRWTADANGHGHAFTFGGVVSAVLVNLPVQTKFRLVVNLSAIHPQVVFAARVFRDHQRQRDEVAAVHGPCFGNGKFGQIVGQSNPLALAFSHLLRRHRKRIAKEWQTLPRLPHVEADVGFHHRHHAVADLRFMGGAQRSQGSVVTAKSVHEQRDGGNCPVGQPRLFKQHGWTIVFDQQIGDGSRFVDHVHRAVDAKQFAPLFEVVHPPPQRLPCHG